MEAGECNRLNKLATWLEPEANRLLASRSSFPQSLLIVGQEGVGKSILAEHLVSSLLCDDPGVNGQACGQCQQCLLFRAGNHPDFHAVLTENQVALDGTRLAAYGTRYLTDNQRKSGKKTHSESILIDQIRAMSANAVSTPQLADKSVVYISPADRLNRNAANALLKILEEPVSTTYFVLSAHRISTLPATIRSRCNDVYIPLPARELAQNWLTSGNGLAAHDADIALDLAAGAPVTALKLNESKLIAHRSDWLKSLDDLIQQAGSVSALATQWKKSGSRPALLWFYGWVRDLVILQSGNNMERPSINLFNADCLPKLRIQSKRLDLRRLMTFLSLVEQQFSLLNRANVDETLVLEEVLINWNKLFSEHRQDWGR